MNDPAQQKRFVELLTGHQRQLYVFISTFLADPHAIDEVLQRANVVLWEKAGEFDIDTNFAAWAMTVARFEVLAYCKTRGRDRLSFNSDVMETLAAEALVDVDMAQRRRDALLQCLPNLPEKDRGLLHQHYEGALTAQQLAEQSGRPLKSIYRSLARARQQLLDCIQRRLRREEGSV